MYQFTINTNGKNFTPADLMSRHAKANGGKIETTRHFETLLIMNGKKYRYDHCDDIRSDPVTVYLQEVNR